MACLHHLVQLLLDPFKELFTKMFRAHCAAAPANDTNKRLRSSLNDEELLHYSWLRSRCSHFALLAVLKIRSPLSTPPSQ